MCDYQGYEFGAPYLDSVCIDGFLWDADSCDEPGGPLYHGGEMPCPKCSHEAWLADHCEEVLEDGFKAHYDGKPRECLIEKDKLRYPNDFEALVKAWLKGWDQSKKEWGS